MSKFLVCLHPNMKQVEIFLDGYGPTASDGMTEIGSFELDMDPTTTHTMKLAHGGQDHIFIEKAREVLQEHMGDKVDISGFAYADKATNALQDRRDYDEADMSTDALPATEGGTDPDVSPQPGGEASTATGEDHATHQAVEGDAEAPPATETAAEVEEPTEPVSEDEGSEGETVSQLKTRIATITDKDELEAIYKTEQEGNKRSTALKAIEARAAELSKADEAGETETETVSDSE